MRVITAGQVGSSGFRRSIDVDAVAEVCCCTIGAGLTLEVHRRCAINPEHWRDKRRAFGRALASAVAETGTMVDDELAFMRTLA
jgi:hypothetical protein